MSIGVLDRELRMDHLLRSDIDYRRPAIGGEAIFDLAGDLNGKRVLDLGCGLGPYRERIESRGAEWIGLDVSGPGPAVVGDGMRLPFGDDSFDGVLCAAVLEHIPDPPSFVSELGRVLKPGGVLFGYVSFLEPFHGMSYFHMTHMGLEYLLMTRGFSPQNIFAPSSGPAFLVENLLFAKRLPVVQPLARVFLRAGFKALTFSNRLGRELLMQLRRIPGDQRAVERAQYSQLLDLRYAVGLNFVARLATDEDGRAASTGYLSMVREG